MTEPLAFDQGSAFADRMVAMANHTRKPACVYLTRRSHLCVDLAQGTERWFITENAPDTTKWEPCDRDDANALLGVMLALTKHQPSSE